MFCSGLITWQTLDALLGEPIQLLHKAASICYFSSATHKK